MEHRSGMAVGDDSVQMIVEALDNISDAFVIYDATGGLVVCNTSFKRLYGYSDEDARPGVHFGELGRIDLQRGNVIVGDELGGRDRYLALKAAYRRELKGSFEVRLADGRWIRTTDRPTSNGGFVSIQTDITELKLAERTIRSRYAAVIGALDHLRTGIAIVLGGGELVVENRTARDMLNAGDGLDRDGRGRLRAWRTEDARSLEAAMRQAAEATLGCGTGGRTLVTVQRRSGQTPYLVTVSPIADDNIEPDPRFRGATVTVIDPDDRSMDMAAGLVQLFGLTPAEADIAALVAQGWGVDAIAQARGTSVATVRTQVKSLLAKTNSSSRADLVRLAVMVRLPFDGAQERDL